MGNVELEAKTREEIGKKLKGLRNRGLIPAIVYGKKIKPLAISIDNKTFFRKILGSEAGRNAIIALKVDGGKEIPAITSDIQFDPLTDSILHVDFNHIVMDEAIKTHVPIELRGIAIGVKEDGGILIHGLREVEIECLPGNIPDNYIVDVASLKIGDSLHVSDLPKNDKIKILSTATEMIASCAPPAKEEEAVPLPTPAEVPSTEGAPTPAEGATEEKGKEKSAPAAAPAKGAPPPAKSASAKAEK